ncbi:hypothetical protein [Phaeovulum sp.]|uniref:hypothetical protein n=1 Tax=Phaeovulum sp. TaxID=2934796 RepID=UPI0027302BC4|nr:hypothetical protein [Phaeovulum sp.]MDP1667516.1 hypothetical protein [Phaeovulum sp.]MDP2063709.1 hypothetical protein [Phaeovulum sp.]MDZ4120033.1 hypothetical protein [Phaeovulum sp.]
MKRRTTYALAASVLALLVAAGVAVQAASWDSITLKMNPVKGEAVAYDRSDCTAPGAQGYFVFIDKPGVTYTSVGWFNDKASCITLGPKTRVRIYQHINFKGSTKDIENPDSDVAKTVELSGWWNDTLSSIKVWTMP